MDKAFVRQKRRKFCPTNNLVRRKISHFWFFMKSKYAGCNKKFLKIAFFV